MPELTHRSTPTLRHTHTHTCGVTLNITEVIPQFSRLFLSLASLLFNHIPAFIASLQSHLELPGLTWPGCHSLCTYVETASLLYITMQPERASSLAGDSQCLLLPPAFLISWLQSVSHTHTQRNKQHTHTRGQTDSLALHCQTSVFCKERPCKEYRCSHHLEHSQHHHRDQQQVPRSHSFLKAKVRDPERLRP